MSRAGTRPLQVAYSVLMVAGLLLGTAQGVVAADPSPTAPTPTPTPAAPVATPAVQIPVVSLAEEPGGKPVSSLSISIPAASDTSGTTVYLSLANDMQAAATVLLYSTTVFGGPAIALKDATGEPGTTLSVEFSSGASMPIAVEISATWTGYGTATSELLANSPAGDQLVATITVDRAGAKAMAIIEADTDNKLTIPSQGESLDTRVTVQAGDTGASAVTGRIAPLVDAATGKSVPVETPEQVLDDLGPLSQGSLELKAKLPQVGTFTTSIQLEHDGVFDPPVVVTVNRTALLSHVKVEGQQVSNADVWPLSAPNSQLWPRSFRHTTSYTLTETAGREAIVSMPLLVNPSETANGATHDRNIKVAGTTVLPTDQADCSQPTSGSLITISAFGSCRIEVTYQFDDPPGKYEGILRFPMEDTQAVDFATTLQVRLNVWTASALIFLGLFLGWLLHGVLKRRRLAQRLEVDVARAAQHLGNEVAAIPGGLLDDQETQLRNGMRRVLATIKLSDSDDEERRTELKTRLRASNLMIDSVGQWMLVRRAALKSSAAQGTALELLAGIAMTMTSESTNEVAAGAVAGRIEAVRTDLHDRQVQVVTGEIASVTSQLDSLVDAELRGRVKGLLDQASHVVAESPTDAAASLNLARLELADAYLDQVETIIGRTASEAGLPEAEWRLLTDRVRAKMEADRVAGAGDAIQAARATGRLLLNGLITLTHAVVEQAKAKDPAPAPARMEELNSALELLESARQKLRQDLIADAQDLYEQARTKINASGGRRQVDETERSRPMAADAVGVPDRSVILGKVPGKADAPSLPDADQAARGLALTNRLIEALTVALGVIVGLAGLYAGNPTWGSLADIAVALLWGAGLISVGTALGGYVGVRDKLAE